MTEPKYITTHYSIGETKITLKGENWGNGLEDTAVTIEAGQLCWIRWEDKESFVKELHDVINKYRI